MTQSSRFAATWAAPSPAARLLRPELRCPVVPAHRVPLPRTYCIVLTAQAVRACAYPLAYSERHVHRTLPFHRLRSTSPAPAHNPSSTLALR